MSPPHPGPSAAWLPVRPAVPLEMSTRQYRTNGSRPKHDPSTFQPPTQDPYHSLPSGNHYAPARERGQDRYPPSVRGPVPSAKAVARNSSGIGHHARYSSPSHRSAPYQSREHQDARASHPNVPPSNAEAGPSKPNKLNNSHGASARVPVDYEGDAIMQEAAEGLVQEQRRSLRGRAARSGLRDDGSEVVGGGSEMSVIAGVSASGRGVRIGGSVKIGTGPGGVQRKKTKGDVNVVSLISHRLDVLPC